MTHRINFPSQTFRSWTLAGLIVSLAVLPVASRWLSFAASVAIADEAPPAAAPAARQEFDPAHAEKMKEGLDLFKTTVREILKTSCVDCHGGAEVQSGLDLATRKGLMRGGSKGPAVVAGKSIESNLWRFASHKEKPFMPEDGEKLADEKIAALAKWIDLGAPYDAPLVDNPRDPDAWTANVVREDARKFWSYQPLAKTAVPTVQNAAWLKNPVDAFVLAQQEAKGLTPAPLANKRQLIRRAYFDLIGLPPAAADVEKFVADPDPQAYSKLLDQLLANPHFGERWGRHWLDVARFAESHGFEQDYDRPHAYHYRDFVIEAMNSDMPFNQFVRWQLAGDEYEPENPLALKATGFLGAGVYPTQITANEVERTRYDSLDDMASTTTSAMLGLSVGCARCHDHKFDPIPQADYYRMLAIFTTTVRADLVVNLEPAAFAKEKLAFETAHAPIAAALTKFEQEQLPARLAEWEASGAAAKALNTWLVLDLAETKSAGGTTFTKQPDGSYLASGSNANFETYTFTANVPGPTVSGIRLEALADPSFAAKGPGRAANGNFDLTDFQVTFTPAAGGQPVPVTLQNPQATFEQAPSLLIRYALDDDKKSGWAVDPQFGKDHAAVFELADPKVISGSGTLTFTLDFQGNNQHNIGRPRLSLTSSPLPIKPEVGGLPQALATALQTPTPQRSAEQTAAILKWYAPQDAAWQKLNQAVVNHLAQAPKPKTATMMVCSEGVPAIRHHTQGGDFLPETHFLKRGDCDQKQGVAQPSYLQVLMLTPEKEKHWQQTPPAGAKTSYRRKALAEWITDTDQGAGQLLARVIVNRLWQQHFGRGIVSTPSDFGVQGTRPSHPELLDWLASELIRENWHLKPIHKLMMSSNVYQQATTMNAANAKVDPENNWLWRRTPKRLEAEIVRDNLLATSGALDSTMFGPGSLEETHRRRSIYFMMKRSRLIPMMQLFDQPEPLVSVGGRPSTTIAPQALMLMNHPQVRLYAHTFAGKLLKAEDKSPASLVKQAYLTAVAREPDADEAATAVEFLAQETASYEADPAKKAQAQELALADFCQVLFGLNEFVYVE